ncbi:MAG TPA: HAD family phosphatase [Spirochaetes bacterium]|nr:HAD family phosphatase [Spirochaetota bacterium]
MNYPYYFKDHTLQHLFKNTRLFIFDMNGLMIDDEEFQLRSVNMTLRDLSIKLNENYWIENCLGRRADEYYPDILKKHNVDMDKYSIPILVKTKNCLYCDLITGSVKSIVRPGVLSFIDFISHNNDRKTALVTSALLEEIETVIGKKALDLKKILKYIVSGSDVVNSKPDPEAYIKVSELSGVHPASCLVFEDSETGINAAFNAKMRCVAVPNRYTADQYFKNADHVVDNLTSDAQILS